MMSGGNMGDLFSGIFDFSDNETETKKVDTKEEEAAT